MLRIVGRTHTEGARQPCAYAAELLGLCIHKGDAHLAHLVKLGPHLLDGIRACVVADKIVQRRLRAHLSVVEPKICS